MRILKYAPRQARRRAATSKRANPKLALASKFPTFQELGVRAIKLLFRYEQYYMFINMSRYISSDNKEADLENPL
jgi:hypothetical protein